VYAIANSEPVFAPIDGEVSFDSLYDAQQAGTTDIIWSGVTVTEERNLIVRLCDTPLYAMPLFVVFVPLVF
jgi:hypothetical protein